MVIVVNYTMLNVQAIQLCFRGLLNLALKMTSQDAFRYTEQIKPT